MQPQPTVESFSTGPTGGKVPVSRRALVARINRRLRETELTLRISRPNSRSWAELGEFYLVNDGNHVTGPWVSDLEAYGREVGALKEYEVLV